MLQKLYSWYGRWPVRIVLALLCVLTFMAAVFSFSGEDPVETPVSALPAVRVAPAASLSDSAAIDIIGTVAAVSQANVQAEADGRVVAVNASLGDRVAAGSVLVELENAAERAAVLQAEGAYEAALAAAAQSAVSVGEAGSAVETAKNNLAAARNSAVSVIQQSFTSGNDVVRNDLDQFFSNPDAQLPGVRVDGFSFTNTLNTERVALQTVLSDWRDDSNQIDAGDDLDSALDQAEDNLLRIRQLVDIFTEILPRQKANSIFTETELAAAQSEMATARGALTDRLTAIAAIRTQIANAEQSVVSAEDARRRAEIGGGDDPEVSAADASVKQALGALRSAQASLAKTIVRAPIAGEVNKIDVNVGDYLPPLATVAVIANNQALEITAFVGEQDLALISVGDPVTIEETISGVVTAVAPAVDPVTKKTEIKIATEDSSLQNGQAVRLALAAAPASGDQRDTALRIPLSAVKITPDGPIVFTVADNETLTAHPVVLGAIQNDTVVVLEGISADLVIVTDARGHKAGEEVSVSN